MTELQALSDAELVELGRQAPEGDLRAFEVLVSRYQERVLTNCRCITRSPEDAPDLAQEVFVKAFYGLASFEGRAQFGTWINRIKVNHCLNFLKKRAGRQEVSRDDPDVYTPEPRVQPAVERRAAATEMRRLIFEILDSLPRTLRLPLVMRDLDRMTYQDIADELGIGLSAVKMRIKRAREEFRRRYEAAEASAGTEEVGA